MIGFYKRLPAGAFLSYLAFYYPFLISSILLVFFKIFGLVSSAGVFMVVAVFASVPVIIYSAATGSSDFRSMLVVSSALNVGLLVLLIVILGGYDFRKGG